MLRLRAPRGRGVPARDPLSPASSSLTGGGRGRSARRRPRSRPGSSRSRATTGATWAAHLPPGAARPTARASRPRRERRGDRPSHRGRSGGRELLAEPRDELPVMVRPPDRHHVHDDQADALLEVALARADEGPAMLGPILVCRAHQLDRPDQHGARLPRVDRDLDHVGDADEREGRDRRSGPPGWRSVGGAGRRVEGRHVDLDPELDVRLGEHPRREALVELGGQGRGPGVVERVPVALRAQGGLEVVAERHASRIALPR